MWLACSRFHGDLPCLCFFGLWQLHGQDPVLVLSIDRIFFYRTWQSHAPGKSAYAAFNPVIGLALFLSLFLWVSPLIVTELPFTRM